MTATTNDQVLGTYIATAATREIPPDVFEAARLCLTDWMAVAIGAAAEPAGQIVRNTVLAWRSQGRASLVLGGTAAAPMAALINGTLAHCLDFDDTYVESITHTSAPVWAATLALGEEIGATEDAMLRAFITGFEVVTRIGHGLGQAVTSRGWHGTGVFGRLGAAASAATLLRLDAPRAITALALAATQTSGLTASFGTMAKPFHAGKAAMDGILAAQLAAGGFSAGAGLFSPGGGLDNTVIQDRSHQIAPIDFSGWRILNNSFKPYAACHLIHAGIDAAHALRAEGFSPDSAQAIHAEVGPLALQMTGMADGQPQTPLAGKFDYRYCIALALHGRDLSAADFREPWHLEPDIAALAGKIDVAVGPRGAFASATLTVETAAGPRVSHVHVAKGNPGNPMDWADMRRKFDGLVTDRLGNRAPALFDALRDMGSGRALPAIHATLT